MNHPSQQQPTVVLRAASSLLLMTSMAAAFQSPVIPARNGAQSSWSKQQMLPPSSSLLQQQPPRPLLSRPSSSSSALGVSIGLGPEEEAADGGTTLPASGETPLIPGVDYEIPNHEAFRTSRRSRLDEQCDAWFAALLEGPEGAFGAASELTADTTARLTTPVPLVNEVMKHQDDPDYTPYVATKLPWTPLVPAYGLEVYGLPVPRRNAETWRQFDVGGMIQQDYSAQWTPETAVPVDAANYESLQQQLVDAGVWLENDACAARLVYVDGVFVEALSNTNDWAQNLASVGDVQDPTVRGYLARLTDGFTDELVAPVPVGTDERLTSYKLLSKPNHNLGEPTSQFAVNTQQGTACFAALNTIKTQNVAYVHAPARHNRAEEAEEEEADPQPVLIIHATSPSGGIKADQLEEGQGTSIHPRTLVVAEEEARLSVVQSHVDVKLTTGGEDQEELQQHVPKLVNGYTQVFVHASANLTHSYLEESGGVVTAEVEKSDDEFAETETPARVIEAERPELKDTRLEAVDVHVLGEEGTYQGTIMGLGGSGRIRTALSVSLLKPGTHATVQGFCLCGGAQRTDIKTNIHHIAQGTTSQQLQKNMIGGRATGAFRGRIRVEQSAQQTDSQQLCRSILLSDKCRAWTVPSLEIIADDVQCTHGATVSDLSEEEVFYLRARGLDRIMSRNLLMYAFANDIMTTVDPAFQGSVDDDSPTGGLQRRIIRRMENLVPQGDRAVQGEYQSI